MGGFNSGTVFFDMTGQRFGRLSVVERAENVHGKVRWSCLCDCGKTTVVNGFDLRRGHTTSCDCLRRERSAAALSAASHLRTGEKNTSYKHGATGTKLYHVWAQMIQRCTNPNHRRYADWGGRGISMCSEWRNDFSAFERWARSNGYEEGLTIDRADNNGNYCPGNCRWSTVAEQNQNKRAYKNHRG